MDREDGFANGPYDLSSPPDWSQFPGLYPPLYTQTPDAFFDWVAPFLPDIELRVLIYLIRRTLGFKKQGDQITVEQIASGIITREGVRLDWGTQLGERSVQRALAGLENKCLIERHRQIDPERGFRPSYIRLRLCDQTGSAWQGRYRAGRVGGVPPVAPLVSGESPPTRPAGHHPGAPTIGRASQGAAVPPDTYNRQIPQERDPQETVPPPPLETDQRGGAQAILRGAPLWEQIKAELHGILAPSVYLSRVARTEQIACSAQLVSVRCPDAQTCRWLERSLGRRIAEIATLFVEESPVFRFLPPE